MGRSPRAVSKIVHGHASVGTPAGISPGTTAGIPAGTTAGTAVGASLWTPLVKQTLRQVRKYDELKLVHQVRQGLRARKKIEKSVGTIAQRPGDCEVSVSVWVRHASV